MQGQGQMMQVSKHHDASDGDGDDADYANANAYAGQGTFDVGVQEIQDRRLFHVFTLKSQNLQLVLNSEF